MFRVTDKTPLCSIYVPENYAGQLDERITESPRSDAIMSQFSSGRVRKRAVRSEVKDEGSLSVGRRQYLHGN